MDEKIILVNEDGEEVEFYIDEQFEFEDNLYVVLYEKEEDDDALLFKILEDEDGEMQLIEVEDDDEFERVSEFYFEN